MIKSKSAGTKIIFGVWGLLCAASAAGFRLENELEHGPRGLKARRLLIKNSQIKGFSIRMNNS